MVESNGLAVFLRHLRSKRQPLLVGRRLEGCSRRTSTYLHGPSAKGRDRDVISTPRVGVRVERMVVGMAKGREVKNAAGERRLSSFVRLAPSASIFIY